MAALLLPLANVFGDTKTKNQLTGIRIRKVPCRPGCHRCALWAVSYLCGCFYLQGIGGEVATARDLEPSGSLDLLV